MAFAHYFSIVHPQITEVIIGAETSERLLHDIETWDKTARNERFVIAINCCSNPNTFQWSRTLSIYTNEHSDKQKSATCQFVFYQSNGIYTIDFTCDEIKDFVSQIRMFDAAVKDNFVIGFILHDYPYVTISEIKDVPTTKTGELQGYIQ